MADMQPLFEAAAAQNNGSQVISGAPVTYTQPAPGDEIPPPAPKPVLAPIPGPPQHQVLLPSAGSSMPAMMVRSVPGRIPVVVSPYSRLNAAIPSNQVSNSILSQVLDVKAPVLALPDVPDSIINPRIGKRGGKSIASESKKKESLNEADIPKASSVNIRENSEEKTAEARLKLKQEADKAAKLDLSPEEAFLSLLVDQKIASGIHPNIILCLFLSLS